MRGVFDYENLIKEREALNLRAEDPNLWDNQAEAQKILRERTEAILNKHNVKYELQWILSGQPFLTPRGDLVNAVVDAIKSEVGLDTELSTSGGTSDGRFIAPLGVEVVELGPINASIHKIDECVDVAELEELALVYEDILSRLLTP